MYSLQMKFNIFHSFLWAYQGIVSCIRRERNFRIHMVATFYTCVLGVWMRLNRTQWAVLLLTQGAVLSMELVNTAIEAAIDLCSPQQHPLAKIAKDTAAGAVLVSALFSAAVGISLFWNSKLLQLAVNILTSPRIFIVFMVSMIFMIWFIFGFKEKIKNK